MIRVKRNNMPGLLATKRITTFSHPFHHVAITNLRAAQCNVVCFEIVLKPTVAHICCDNRITGKFTLLLEFKRQNSESMIAIYEHPFRCHEDHAVSIPVESNTQIGVMGLDGLQHVAPVTPYMFGPCGHVEIVP